MDVDIVEKAIDYLLTLANKRKSNNMEDTVFDRESVKRAITTRQADENGWNDIIHTFEDQEKYLQHSRLAITELGKCKSSDFDYNGEDPKSLTESVLEVLYKEGVCWDGTVVNNVLVVTVNVLLDVIQHMGGNELWLFNRIHKDISDLKIKVKCMTEALPENWTQAPVWTATNFSYYTDSHDIRQIKNVLERVGCQIQNKRTDTADQNRNIAFTQVYYSFRFTDTALGCPMELSMGSGCFNKSGQNVPMERKDGTAYSNGDDANMNDNKRFINQLMDRGQKNTKPKSNDDKNEIKSTNVSYIFRGKFPTIGPRNNFDEHKYIAKRYIDFLDNTLASLPMSTDQMYDGDIFNAMKDKYENNLAVYLALIHPKTKYRFLLSLFLTVVLMKTRGYRRDAHLDSKKKKLVHGRNTRVTHMDHTAPRFRLVCDTCVCKCKCEHANTFYPHVSHAHQPLSVMNITAHDPMMSYGDSNFNAESKCYPNRVIHYNYCPMVFPCKRAKQSDILIKNNQLSMRQKDSMLNVQTYTEDLLNGMAECHRQSCALNTVEEYLNNVVLRPWGAIRDTAKKNGMSYRDLVLRFLRIPLLFGNIEKEMNDDYYNETLSPSSDTPKHSTCYILYKKYQQIRTVFESLSLFFDYDISNIYPTAFLPDKKNQKSNCQSNIQDGFRAVAFLTNKKAASFITTINNHFYIMSHTALSGFRHKCELNPMGLTNQDGLMFHQITLHNYSLICSPDYISANKSQQDVIDDAVIEGIVSDRRERSNLLDLAIREEIDDLLNNNDNRHMDLFNISKGALKTERNIKHEKINGTTAATAAAAAASAADADDDDDEAAATTTTSTTTNDSNNIKDIKEKSVQITNHKRKSFGESEHNEGSVKRNKIVIEEEEEEEEEEDNEKDAADDDDDDNNNNVQEEEKGNDHKI